MIRHKYAGDRRFHWPPLEEELARGVDLSAFHHGLSRFYARWATTPEDLQEARTVEEACAANGLPERYPEGRER